MTFTYISATAQTSFEALTFPTTSFAVLIIDPNIQTPKVQMDLSHRLVDAGCTELGAWGPDSTEWDDAGDWAAILNRDNSLRAEPVDMDTWWFDKSTLDEAIADHLSLCEADRHVVIEFGTTFGEKSITNIWAAGTQAAKVIH